MSFELDLCSISLPAIHFCGTVHAIKTMQPKGNMADYELIYAGQLGTGKQCRLAMTRGPGSPGWSAGNGLFTVVAMKDTAIR